jgi:hypothetical protein
MNQQIRDLKKIIEELKRTSDEREKLLSQCVTLLSLVRPEIHKQALERVGISEEAFRFLVGEIKP